MVKDFKLHKDFTNGGKKLVPVFFSHGLIVNRTNHSVICRELASNGCIVYAFDHTDGSCSYYLDVTKDQPKDVYYTEYDPKIHAFSHEEYRRRQTKIRLDDVEQLLKYVKETEIKQNPSINLAKLCYCGHSMGGFTSIEACRKFDEDFKYCISLDPFFRARFEEIEKNSDFVVKQPLIMISTEYFHRRGQRFLENFDSLKVLNKFFDDCNNSQKGKTHKNYNLILEDAHHLNQYDMCLEDGYLLWYFGQSTITCDPLAKLKENNELILSFMKEHKLL